MPQTRAEIRRLQVLNQSEDRLGREIYDISTLWEQTLKELDSKKASEKNG